MKAVSFAVPGPSEKGGLGLLKSCCSPHQGSYSSAVHIHSFVHKDVCIFPHTHDHVHAGTPSGKKCNSRLNDYNELLFS